MQDTNQELMLIKDSSIFNRFLINKKYNELANSLFLDTTEKSEKIVSLRYIDKHGKEKLRISRDSSTSKPYISKLNNIKNKTNTSYFKAIMSIEKDKTWYSKLETNENDKKIKQTTIYIGTPIFVKNQKVGILVADILMKDILHDLTHNPSNQIFMFDSDGNTLIDSKHNSYWSKYLDYNNTIFNCFNEKAKYIISNEEYVGEDFYSSKIYLNNSELLYMIIKKMDFSIEKWFIKNYQELVFATIILIILSVPLSYIFARIPVKQKLEDDRHKYDQEVLLSLFDLSDAVLFKWKNDETWSVKSVSKSVTKLLGYTQNDFQNGSVSYTSCIHPDDLDRVVQDHANAIRHRAYYFEHTPYRLIRKDGEIRWILHSTVIVRNEKNNIINFVGYLNDITELKNNEIELKKISITDQLTKINNRMHTDHILLNQYNRFKRDKEDCSVIILDIDHFKSVNDNYGHLVGDNVLIEFARVLKNSIRAEDVLGRWGGEEFLIILPHTNLSKAILLAEKLRVAIDTNEFPTLGHLTASFGVSSFEEGMSIDTLVETADKSLYESKKSGRNRVTAIQETKD